MRADRIWRAAIFAGLAASGAGCATATGGWQVPSAMDAAAPVAAEPTAWERADPTGWSFVAQSPAALALAEVDVRFTHRIGEDVRLDETFRLALTPLDNGDEAGPSAVHLARLAAEDVGRARLVQTYLSTRALEAGRSGYTVFLGFAPGEDEGALAALCEGGGALFTWMRFDDADEMAFVEPALDAAFGLTEQFEAARAQVCVPPDSEAAEDADDADPAPQDR